MKQVVIVSYTTTVSYLTGPLLGKALANATEKKAQTAKSDWSEGRSILKANLNERVKEGTEWSNSHPTSLPTLGCGCGQLFLQRPDWPRATSHEPRAGKADGPKTAVCAWDWYSV